MRLLFSVLLLLLAIGLLSFVAINLDNTVTIQFWASQYDDVLIGYVVLASVFVGVVLTGIFAIAEGAKIRLENRRLRRELRKLETEVNYLRTQPRSALRPEPDVAEPGAAVTPAREDDAPSADAIARAPVYDPNDRKEGLLSLDPDDEDYYSGGSAV